MNNCVLGVFAPDKIVKKAGVHKMFTFRTLFKTEQRLRLTEKELTLLLHIS